MFGILDILDFFLLHQQPAEMLFWQQENILRNSSLGREREYKKQLCLQESN